jgi:hypothetical protein
MTKHNELDQVRPLRTFSCASGQLITTCVLLLLIKTFSPTPLLAYEYEVVGTLSYVYSESVTGDIIVDQEQNFSIEVSDCKFFLKKVPTKFIKFGKEAALEDYIVASTDLTNFYYLVSLESIVNSQINSKSKQTNTKAQPQKPLSGAAGIIGNGQIPYGTDPTINLIWYAFASGCYFKKEVDDQFIFGITPFRNVGYYSQDFRVRAQWEIESAAPFLPKKYYVYRRL